MTFSIVCAWKDLDDAYRRRGFEFTRRYWKYHFPEAELVVGEPDPFTRAAGLNEAVRDASYDLILQADPDTIVPPAQAVEALRLAGEGGLVVAYDEYLYLDEKSTRTLHDAPLGELPLFGPRDCQISGRGGAGPVTAFTRATWAAAHGYDERFGLWGGDDIAFMHAVWAYTGIEMRTVPGSALHSYHPRLPDSIPGNPGYAKQWALTARYRDAAAIGRHAVRNLVEQWTP